MLLKSWERTARLLEIFSAESGASMPGQALVRDPPHAGWRGE